MTTGCQSQTQPPCTYEPKQGSIFRVLKPTLPIWDLAPRGGKSSSAPGPSRLDNHQARASKHQAGGA
jgi:hypothetical protein